MGLPWGSSESPGDVRLGTLLARAGEQALSVLHLDELAEVEEGRPVRDARGLLKVVRDDDDRELALQLVDELLDLLGRRGIERRRRLIEEQHFGVVRQRARD